MTPSTNAHLTHDELLIAAVDKQDLEITRRTHLSECPACRREHDQLQGRLERIGRTARHLAPEPARPFRLPEKGRAAARRSFRNPLWIAGISVAMLLALLLWRPPWGVDSMSAPVLARDRQLMASVDALVQDALPEPYQLLAVMDDPVDLDETDTGDDFLDWIVPPLNDPSDDSLS